MKVKKADDYQSWYVQEGDRALLIDPWFDSALVDGKGWFLQRRKEKKKIIAGIQKRYFRDMKKLREKYKKIKARHHDS